MSAYHFKYFQNIQFKNHGIAPTPPYLPTLKAYSTPGVGGRFGIFSLKWRERMNLKVPGTILPLGCAILSTRAKTVRGGVGTTPPLRRTRVNDNFGWPFFTLSSFNIYQCGAHLRHLNFVQALAISLDLLVTLNHPILCHSNVSQNKNFSLKSIYSIVHLDLT